MMLFYYIEELFNYKENKHHFALLSGVYKMLFQDFLHSVSDPTNLWTNDTETILKYGFKQIS